MRQFFIKYRCVDFRLSAAHDFQGRRASNLAEDMQKNGFQKDRLSSLAVSSDVLTSVWKIQSNSAQAVWGTTRSLIMENIGGTVAYSVFLFEVVILNGVEQFQLLQQQVI